MMKYTFTQSEGHTETWEYTIPVNGAELVSKAVSGANLCDRCSKAIEAKVPSVSLCWDNTGVSPHLNDTGKNEHLTGGNLEYTG